MAADSDEEMLVFKATGDQAARHWPVNNLGQVHQVEVVAPTSLADTSCALRGGTFFAARCTLHELTSMEFIESNLRGSHFSAVTTGPVDRSSSLAICPDGRLVMRLARATFEMMGVDGRRCPHSKEFYIVEIPLLADTFAPGKPAYDRLRKVPTCSFDVLACRTVDGEPTPVVFPEGVTCREYETAPEARPHGLVQAPVWNGLASLSGANLNDFGEALIEWVGELTCGVRGSCAVQDNEDGSVACFRLSREWRCCGRYVSALMTKLEALDVPQHRTQLDSQRVVGLVHAEHVCTTIEALRQAVTQGEMPWAVMVVWGFEDSLVPCWASQGNVSCGARGTRFMILILPSGECLVCQMK